MRAVTAIAVLGMAMNVAACDNMANQPKRLPYELPYGAKAADWPALPPQNTVARDDPGKPPDPPPVTQTLLERGQQRFDIYCSPCHGRAGDGNGAIVKRGFPHPPSYDEARLRSASNQHIYDVITNGYGVMYSYAARVDPADRWAIVAYVRALQASANASLSDVPAEERHTLQ